MELIIAMLLFTLIIAAWLILPGTEQVPTATAELVPGSSTAHRAV
ncbi:MAG: hypothetical protein WCP31_10545 [Chloroflexales bacterium]